MTEAESQGHKRSVLERMYIKHSCCDYVIGADTKAIVQEYELFETCRQHIPSFMRRLWFERAEYSFYIRLKEDIKRKILVLVSTSDPHKPISRPERTSS